MPDRAQLHERLAGAVDQMAASQDFALWLQARRYHRSYSFRNRLLIMLQAPEATRVMGFRPWLRFGRVVAKGEHGIRILGPMRVKRIDEQGREGMALIGFREVSVFDITQTVELPPRPNGRPYLPLEPPRRPDAVTSPEAADSAERAIAGALEVPVRYEPDAGESHGGYYRTDDHSIVVIARGGREDQLRVLCHEAAHHHGATYTAYGRARAEVIADAAAWIVLAELELGQGDPFYIAHWASQSTATTLQDQTAIDQIADAILAPLLEGEPTEGEPDSGEAAVAA